MRGDDVIDVVTTETKHIKIFYKRQNTLKIRRFDADCVLVTERMKCFVRKCVEIHWGIHHVLSKERRKPKKNPKTHTMCETGISYQ